MSRPPGSRVGSYEIVSLLGAGGMGEVYRARDARLGRDVAIKLLPDGHAIDRERRARVEREAQMLAALNHPNIAAIYGVEDAAGAPALVMELVEGPTLADRIAGGPVPIPEAIDIARQVALALDAAHERGIVHRDLKPANIKLAAGGVVKVLDFGLAKAVVVDAGTPDLAHSPTVSAVGTAAGVILGTVAYMSPEQARGQIVDKRTDIWAFGCVLFEMLAGVKAFPGATVSDVIAAILTREPSWPRLPSGVPPAIAHLLRRCLEKDQRKRLRDIGDAFVEPLPAVTGRRHVRLAPVAAGAALAALAAALATAMLMRAPASPDSGVRHGSTIASRLTAYGGVESSPAIAPDGRAFVFVSDHGGTPDIWLRQIAGGEPVRLTNDAAPESDLVYAPDGDSVYFTRTDADAAGIWQTGVLGGRPRRIVAGARGPAPAPDGRHLAFLQRDSPLTLSLVVRALDGAESRVLARALPNGTSPPAWSRDGRRLAYARGGLFAPSNLFVIAVATGEQRQVTRFTRGIEGVQSVAWLPDNRHVVVSYVPIPRMLAEADLGVADVETGAITRLTTTVGGGLTLPSVSADGTRMVVTSFEGAREVWRVPAGPGVPPTRLAGARGDPMWIFPAAGGRTLLFAGTASGARNLWLGPVDRLDEARQITFLQGDAVGHSSLSPDGTRVAFISIATGNSDVWVQNVDGSDLRQLTDDAFANSWPVWSPDGQWIVYSASREHLETWRVPSGGGTPEKLIDGFFRGDWQPQPGGSGTWIVTSNGSDRVRLIDVERRAVLWDLPMPGSASLSLPVFSPDRRSFSMPFQAGRDRDTLGIFDAATGTLQRTIELPVRVFFRAGWAEDGAAFLVNRNANTSHVVMFDRFWAPTP